MAFKLSPPTPELSVPNVAEAQAHYRDDFGFTIAWTNEEGRIGAVSHGECGVFFRESATRAEPVTLWIFADDVDAAHADFVARGADIVGAPSDKPWGLRQFTARDRYGNALHFHHDL